MELLPVSSEEMLVRKVHETHPEIFSYFKKVLFYWKFKQMLYFRKPSINTMNHV